MDTGGGRRLCVLCKRLLDALNSDWIVVVVVAAAVVEGGCGCCCNPSLRIAAAFRNRNPADGTAPDSPLGIPFPFHRHRHRSFRNSRT